MKSPRYALALLFGLLYFFMVFGGPRLFDRSHPSPRADATATALGSITHYFVPILLAMMAAAWWLIGASRGGIALSPAEANLLVPAPISRRRLIEFKILMAQPAVFTSALMFSIVFRGSPLPWGLRFISMWAIFSVLHLHQIGAQLVHAAVQNNGRKGWRRVWPAAVIFGAILSVVAITVVRSIVAMRAAEDGGAMMAALERIFANPLTTVALAPFNAVIAPLNSAGLATWYMPFAICLMILALHYAWVIRMDAAFEEGAVEAGQRVAAAMDAMRKGKRVNLGKRTSATTKIRKPWFKLDAPGDPAFAIWWKNVLIFTRAFSPVWVLIALAVPVVLVAIEMSNTHEITPGLFASGIVFLFAGGMLGLMGPMAMRIDLRTDLRRVELLKTLPVGGARFVVAQLGAAAFVLAMLEFGLLAFGGILMIASGKVEHPGIILLLALPAALLLLAYTAMQLLIYNGFALFFPAWTRIEAGETPGIETLGQNILVMVGGMLILVLSLIPPVIVAAVAGASSFAQWGKYAGIPAGAALLVTLFVEIMLGTMWLGHAYDRIDPVEAGLCQ